MRRRSRASRAPARWSMSGASISPNSPWCWSRTSRCAGAARLLCRHGGADRCAAAHAPPETAIAIDWPDAISVDGGLVGGGRLAWPQGAARTSTPPWLVFGAMIRTVSMTGTEPGLHPLVTALEEEGFTDAMADQLVESFARHFMVPSTPGRSTASPRSRRSYLARLPPEKGLRRDIDENGDLLMRRMGKVEVERKKLLPRARQADLARSGDAGAARVKLLRTIRLDPSDTFVFETRGRARRMGGVGRVRVLEHRCRRARRQGALGVSRRLPRRRFARLVDSGADRRGERRRPRAVVEALAKQLVAHFGAPDHRRPRAPRRRRKSPSPSRSAISRRIR